MNTQRLNRFRRTTPGTWTALVAFASLFPLSSSTFADTPTTQPEPKEYTLFIGANLEVPQGRDYCPVKRMIKNDLEIDVNKSLKRVSIDDVDEYKIVREPKLSSTSANITIARSERTRAGAARAALEALSTSIAVQNENLDTRNRALGAAVRASMTPNTSSTNPAGTAAGSVSPRDAAIYAAEAAFSRASINNDLTNGTYVARKAADSISGDSFDALELDLQISSPKPLSGAHLVLVTECRDPKKPDVLLHRISPKFVGSIGSTPVKVSIEQQGFPAGYILEKEHLFLYSNGTEIVTNLSDSRVEMTRDQTFKYLLVQYIASHDKDSLPPTPIMGAAPANFHSRVDASQLNQTVSISVNKNGNVTDISLEDAGSSKLSPIIEIALKNFRFFPALRNGLPTEGKMKAKLSDLFRNT